MYIQFGTLKAYISILDANSEKQATLLFSLRLSLPSSKKLILEYPSALQCYYSRY